VRVDLELSLKTAVRPSALVMQVAAMFGLGVDQEREVVIVPPTTVVLEGGRVVYVTGPSGGGKSTFLRLIAESVSGRSGVRVIRLDHLPDLPDLPLVDCISGLLPDASIEGVLRILSLAGLNDAFVVLRRPGELSDGQRYRLGLARVLAMVKSGERGVLHVVLVDEFGSTLDRVTAGVIARNVRKWTSREKSVCFVVATAHDDLLEPLEPDVLIEKDLGGRVEVLTRET